MIPFTFPAKYERHVLASLALILAEVGRDSLKTEDDPRYRALATLSDEHIDDDKTGTCMILIGVVNDDAKAA
jgi:hypothetical protein